MHWYGRIVEADVLNGLAGQRTDRLATNEVACVDRNRARVVRGIELVFVNLGHVGGGSVVLPSVPLALYCYSDSDSHVIVVRSCGSAGLIDSARVGNAGRTVAESQVGKRPSNSAVRASITKAWDLCNVEHSASGRMTRPKIKLVPHSKAKQVDIMMSIGYNVSSTGEKQVALVGGKPYVCCLCMQALGDTQFSHSFHNAYVPAWNLQQSKACRCD